jgi:hypothetical protein
MTGDRKYEFSFEKAHDHTLSDAFLQLSLFSEAESELANATDADVMLFSGGLDSLAGAIERLNAFPHRKLGLVSHKSNSTSTSIQNKLFDNLRQDYGERIIKYGFECRNKDMKTKEETQRTRMFLFSAIAYAICDRLKKDKLYVYENGVTSINIPIQVDTVNARASRTTHPKTIALLERFYRLFNAKFKIETPYRQNTKAEVVENSVHIKLKNTSRHRFHVALLVINRKAHHIAELVLSALTENLQCMLLVSMTKMIITKPTLSQRIIIMNCEIAF